MDPRQGRCGLGGQPSRRQVALPTITEVLIPCSLLTPVLEEGEVGQEVGGVTSQSGLFFPLRSRKEGCGLLSSGATSYPRERDGIINSRLVSSLALSDSFSSSFVLLVDLRKHCKLTDHTAFCSPPSQRRRSCLCLFNSPVILCAYCMTWSGARTGV